MTRFDATEANAATATPDNVGNKLQADYLSSMPSGDAKFVRIADVQGAPAQGGDAQDGDGKVGVKEIVAVDPKELSPNLKTLQGLAGHFDKSSDKAKALGEVKPEVEKTIAAADAAQTAAMKQANTEMATLKPKLDADQAAMKAAAAPLQAAAAKVPEANREHVGQELQLLTNDKTSPALKKALEADLAGYAGLVPAAKAMMAAEKAAEPDVKQFQDLKAKVEATAEDPVIARMVYADMLEQGGDKAGALQATKEATALQMGMSIEDFHKLQQQKQPQKP
jgi:hypothetical protein